MDEQPHYIRPEQLCVGLYIYLDLGWMSHPFAFSSFLIRDQQQLLKIRQLSLQQLRYSPQRSSCEPLPLSAAPAILIQQAAAAPKSPPIKFHLRSDRLMLLNRMIHTCKKDFAMDASTARDAVRSLTTHPKAALAKAEMVVDKLVNSMITEGDVVLHAVSSSNAEAENYVHSLNVAVLALMLAKSLDISDEEAQELGMAAIFHDVGKGAESRGKPPMNQHCEEGARAARAAGLSERVARIILQHHEYVDGSGYPKHLTAVEIDPLARLLALVNAFDNLCNPNIATNAMTPYEALQRLYTTESHKYVSSLVHLLIRTLGVYPPGSIVQLSNGIYGIVMTVNPDKPLLPFVMLHIQKVPRETPVIVDLREEIGLTINQCLKPGDLPEEVFDYLSPRNRIYYYFLKNEQIEEHLPDTGEESINQGQ